MDDLLWQNNFHFRKRYGQNFLTDKNLLRSLVTETGIDENATVLEIGAGGGALTVPLAEKAKRVISYEIDESLKPVLSEVLKSYDNVELRFEDFMKADFHAVEKSVGKYFVVANLPYYITTPVVCRLVEESENCLGFCVMVQQEVAARFCAKEGTADYGAITAAIARRGACTLLRKVPKELFTPRPNVDSAFVKADFQTGGFEVKSEKAYRETVRCAFLSRRKTLENNLITAFSLSRERAASLLERAEIARNARGETLSPIKMGELSDLLFDEGVVQK